MENNQFPLVIWGATDPGQQREGNEDSIFPESGAEFYKPSESNVAQKGRLLVVADGMGGVRGGSESSRWAIRAAVERYYDLGGPMLDMNLKQAVYEANKSLFQYLQSTGVQGAGCTMVGAVIYNNKLHVANVGDSRAYLIRNGTITQLTRDHTVTQDKIERGLLTPDQAAMDPDRNVITRSMGTHPEV
ncbi:MAG: serine/threonine-protein phosphatase, partial [Anaerolineae bacterium]|nr:serine/threonine-protein phosphatase [Anaerolineae bacterium]